ncbi:RagB/SusD family nutrient uptake outer membrane protein [Sunxiuqinia rutila]|uniref:RagB/SusD family nutrient uptake outer membrane protein n=1 Tax=Sunxiuqinia rutila TaxID=1397841 RepID=UPI003D368B77
MKKYLILSLVALMSFSCDLDRYPEGDLSDAVFWKTEGDFTQALNALYTSIPGWGRFDDDNMSDIQVGNSANSISEGSYQPSSSFGPWNGAYATIRRANNIITKLGEVDLGVSNALEAEARFFRALAYFQLVKAYGDVPLVLEVLDITSEGLYGSRAPRKEVIDQVIADLDFAATHLSVKSELSQKGRVAKGAALALKARVALYEGTRSKYHNYGYETELLQQAKAAAKAVIESGEYDLYTAKGNGYDNYNSLFLYDGEGSDETILAHEYGTGDDNPVAYFNNRNLEQGQACATRKLLDSYLCTDGLPIEKSPLFQGWTEYASEFENRDPRLLSVILKRGDDLKGAGNPWTPSIYSTLSGVLFKKYAYAAEWETQKSYIDWMFIRYAEVLLVYAEATYELDGQISDADLNISINKLRDRVEMPHLTNAFVQTNGLDMLEEIRRERRCELVMEGFRYDDIMRWKIAEDVMPETVYGARLFAGEYEDVNPESLNLTADSIIIAQPASKRTFDPAKHYLWPLPISQLGLNENLTQNPGWD